MEVHMFKKNVVGNKKRFTAYDLLWWMTRIADKLSRAQITVHSQQWKETVQICTSRGEVLARAEARREGDHEAVITLSVLFPMTINTELLFRESPVPVAIVRSSSLL